ncbi:MAG TPA: class I SAM-dependent methyltransferase [Candidatus Dormibacteraeota bacterium]|nr:class I SAM-dependent methyltransferase [Candidatus Dormibacteraeota bacterium]
MRDYQAEVRDFIKRVFDNLSGLVVSGMIHLGHRLGLYKALDGAGPLTSEALAAKTGLHERWLREWLRGQAAAGLLEYDGAGGFSLSDVGALVLANEQSPAFAGGSFVALPTQLNILEPLCTSFATGVGLPYDAFGCEGALGIEGMLAPWFRTMLVPIALPQLDGVVAKLEAGATAADIGCGTGVALIEMAKAFPRSHFHGYDISTHALTHAERYRREAGLGNVEFHDPRDEPLPAAASFDFVTAFDCLHDMTHPLETMRAVRQALRPDGTWLIADINAKPTFEENLRDNPMAAMMYGFSILSCLSSSLSVPGGAGLGTLGFPEPVARQMAAAAGFTRFTRHDFGNPVNAYYEVRP